MIKVAHHKGNKLTIDAEWISFPVYITQHKNQEYVEKSKDIYIHTAEWQEIVRVALNYWRSLPVDASVSSPAPR